MSDAGTDTGSTAANGTAQNFTEREMQMLAWAMQSLKSGPPDIDFEKLARYAGMTNVRSAGNAWAKIRNKLNTATTDGAVPTIVKKTPQKKKAAAEKADEGDDAVETPTKTPRKRTPKKAEVDGEPTTPKKRGRPVKSKKVSTDDQESPEAIKKEASEEAVEDTDIKTPSKSEDVKPDVDMDQQEV